jgi:hypothetical protein
LVFWIFAVIALKDSSGTEFVERVRAIFSENGLLSKAQNFEFRPQQQEMAVAVARALEEDRHLVVEAGTGVGKSLAYLVPAILFALEQHKKAIISTHTINLQEQLLYKDIPILKKVLPVEFEAALMKGRHESLGASLQRSAHLHPKNLRTKSALFLSTGAQTPARVGRNRAQSHVALHAARHARRTGGT